MRSTTRVARFAVIAGIAGIVLTASTAWSQTEKFRMLQSLDIGWAVSTPVVTCADLRGFTHPGSHTMTWYLNPAGGGAGKDAALQSALQTWSNPGLTDFRLLWGGTKPNGYKQNDGFNMMVWGTDSICDSKSCHAITALLLGPGQVIREADILFNASPTLAFQWMTNGESSDQCWVTASSTGLKIDTQGIATHELGHSLGIHHPTNFSTTAATMGDRACTPDGRTLEADDLSSLRCAEGRYPQNPLYEGVAEQTTCKTISGWAWNRDKGYQTSYVEVIETLSTGFIKVLAVAKAGTYRADLAASGIGDGYHGFSYAVPASTSPLWDQRWHKVRTRYSGTFGALGPDKDLICGVKLFPETMSPNDPDLSTGGLPYEVGTQFSSSVPGFITQIGYDFAPGEETAGSHTVRLWSDSGALLASAPVSNPQHGWTYVSIPRTAIQANVRYRVSINTYAFQSKSSCGTSNSLQNPYTSDPLTAHQGFWRQGDGVFPNTSSCANFFVGVQFET
jgi:hypothetical protein